MVKTDKVRLDERLLELGLAESRSKARALILSGAVVVEGEIVDKAGRMVSRQAEILVKESLPFVSRGGLKLAAALDAFSVNPAGRVCLDVGSSTGGFTDCLLQRGAKKVYAVDVGKGLLAWKLRNDPRVKVYEGINARSLPPALFPEPFSLAVLDVSFISLTLILPAVVPLLEEGAEILPLVKPQFEAGRKEVGKGGVVRNEKAILTAVDKISSFAANLGFREEARFPSPIKGPKGNQEYFLHLLKER